MSRSQPRTEAPEAALQALQAAQEACQACSELSLTIAYLQSQLKHTQSEVATLTQRIEAIERAIPGPTSGYKLALEPER